MLNWYNLPSEEDVPGTPGLMPDYGEFTPTEQLYTVQVEKEGIQVFFVLSEEALPFPIVSHDEVASKGIDPDRTIIGGGVS